MNVTMLAAEYGGNAALRCTPLATAIHELAASLSAADVQVTVVTPGYGVVSGESLAGLDLSFGGITEHLSVIEAAAGDGVRHIALEHPRFSPQGVGRVYCTDSAGEPFATDATKFAFFSAACAEWLGSRDVLPDVVHVHDWPAALYFALREYDPAHLAQRTVRCVYSLHSGDVQGQRPLAFHSSSLRSWFSDLPLPRRAVVDPDYEDCVNPVATALRLADTIVLPSESYAAELSADDQANLASLIRYRQSKNQVVCIESGASPRAHPRRRPTWSWVGNELRRQLRTFIANHPEMRSAHFLCDRALASLPTRRPAVSVSLVGPFDDNAVALLRQPLDTKTSVLDAMLDNLRGGERLIALGEGSAAAEAFLTSVAAHQPRFVYLQGPDAAGSDAVLRACDFHLVLPRVAPSASAALRALNMGRPCLAHDTGGLREVVTDGRNGWLTSNAGSDVVATFVRACKAKRSGGRQFTELGQTAAGSGTPWADIAQRFVDQLYTANPT